MPSTPRAHPTGPLSCRDSTWLVSEARDRPLDADESAGLAQHIDTCPLCRVAARQFADLFDLVGLLYARPDTPPRKD